FGQVFGHHRVSDGWVITSITRFSTGLPIFLRERDDNPLLGTRFTGPNANGVDTPNYTPRDLQFNGPRTGQPYFNIDLFSKEAIGQLCTASKRFFHGHGLNNWDMALLKDTRITESKLLQFRFEFFNVFNHAQFAAPTRNSGSFGFAMDARAP